MTNTPIRFQTLRTGDLLFFSGRRLFSRVIQWKTKSKWSHVGVVVRLFEDKDIFILESLEGKGVRLVPLQAWLRWHGDIGAAYLNLKEDEQKKIVWIGMQHLGEEYASVRQFLRSFSVIWSRVARMYRLSADVSKVRWFCSEYATHLLQAIGRVPQVIKAAKVTPGAMAAEREIHEIW